MTHGPSVRMLIAERASQLGVERAGSGVGDIAARIASAEFLGDLKDAAKWAEDSIALLRGAGQPNPWKGATDEAIAAELLRFIEKRRREQKLDAQKRGLLKFQLNQVDTPK